MLVGVVVAVVVEAEVGIKEVDAVVVVLVVVVVVVADDVGVVRELLWVLVGVAAGNNSVYLVILLAVGLSNVRLAHVSSCESSDSCAT